MSEHEAQMSVEIPRVGMCPNCGTNEDYQTACCRNLTTAQEREAKLQAEIADLTWAITRWKQEEALWLEFEKELKADNANLRGVVEQIRSFLREIREPRAWHGETMETKDEYRRGQDYVARKVQVILAESADVLGAHGKTIDNQVI